ncbi:hypothetical protein PSHT_08246 [Puccinia striiformis]|uniref:Uncharacterized protein n=3 Tax=Puccinia striiformis TaxID=27350 RepID=A0A0L0UUP9_9BASI|nr:hypothetical protein PSTG_15776 [Puccinia striiformis f. sp. tritici PST-78]POW11949.1 hypothetical protein PSHT_08246 [Puccinia striiformis]POW12786.1 hypothetical protein PSTT_04348 [Puccinia striiformis]
MAKLVSLIPYILLLQFVSALAVPTRGIFLRGRTTASIKITSKLRPAQLDNISFPTRHNQTSAFLKHMATSPAEAFADLPTEPLAGLEVDTRSPDPLHSKPSSPSRSATTRSISFVTSAAQMDVDILSPSTQRPPKKSPEGTVASKGSLSSLSSGARLPGNSEEVCRVKKDIDLVIDAYLCLPFMMEDKVHDSSFIPSFPEVNDSSANSTVRTEVANKGKATLVPRSRHPVEVNRDAHTHKREKRNSWRSRTDTGSVGSSTQSYADSKSHFGQYNHTSTQ